MNKDPTQIRIPYVQDSQLCMAHCSIGVDLMSHPQTLKPFRGNLGAAIITYAVLGCSLLQV